VSFTSYDIVYHVTWRPTEFWLWLRLWCFIITCSSASITTNVVSAKFPLPYCRKWTLVLACQRRSTALPSGPLLKRLRLCNMTAVSSSICQWPYTEHVTAHICLVSKPTMSLLHCCYYLTVAGCRYLPWWINHFIIDTVSAAARTRHKVLAPDMVIVISQLQPGFGSAAETDKMVLIC